MTNPVYKHLFIPLGSCLNQRISFMQLLFLFQFTYERWQSSNSDKQTTKPGLAINTAAVFFSQLSPQARSLVMLVPGTCAVDIQPIGLDLIECSEKNSLIIHTCPVSTIICLKDLFTFHSPEWNVSVSTSSLSLCTSSGARELWPPEPRGHSAALSQAFEIWRNNQHPPSLASSTEREREGRRDSCLQVIRMYLSSVKLWLEPLPSLLWRPCPAHGWTVYASGFYAHDTFSRQAVWWRGPEKERKVSCSFNERKTMWLRVSRLCSRRGHCVCWCGWPWQSINIHSPV